MSQHMQSNPVLVAKPPRVKAKRHINPRFLGEDIVRHTVLALLAEGLSNKLIARRLELAEGTVKGYVSQVLDKLGVADRTQAALLAHREGLGASG